MKNNSLLFLIITLALSISCAQKPETEQNNAQEVPISEHENISVSEFNASFAIPDSNTVILDVRTDQEYEAGAIPNSVQLNFMNSDFKNQVSQFDPDKTYIVYCQSGGRSSAASKIMSQELGFENVKNLEGGYSTWSKSE